MDKQEEEDGIEATENQTRSIRFINGLAWTALIITVIVVVILIALRNRIRLAVAIFVEASKAVGAMPHIVLTPIATYIALGLFALYWIAVLVFMSTSGKYELNAATGYAEYSQSEDYSKMWW